MSDDTGAHETRALAPPQNSTPIPGITEEQRAAALRAGTTPVPRRFIHLMILGFAVLGIGGFALDRVIGNGSAGTPAALAENTGGNNGVPTGIPATTFVPTNPSPAPGPGVAAPMNAYLSLKSLGNTPAPRIRLMQLSGSTWSIGNAKGKVIVLTFANAECNDSCSVLANEIFQANRDLGTRAGNVVFVIVNSDPLETARSPLPPLLVNTPLKSMANVVYLTGSLKELSAIWANYGVTVVVQPSTRTVTHNDIMYFINSAGRLSYRVTPFANEGVDGVFTLGTSDVSRFGAGIASTVTKTEGGS